MSESPCDYDCGYYDTGRELWEHVMWEHRDCPECGGRPHGECAVTHRSDCPRLQPGYVYPPSGHPED